MEGVAGHPVGGGMARRGDAARNVFENRQALVRIALACDLDQIFVAGDKVQGGSNPQEKWYQHIATIAMYVQTWLQFRCAVANACP